MNYIEVLDNFQRCNPRDVCKAIDEAIAESIFLSDKERVDIYDKFISIKWSYHYPTVITDTTQACWDNPGWYADIVTYYGWDESLRLKYAKINRGKFNA